MKTMEKLIDDIKSSEEIIVLGTSIIGSPENLELIKVLKELSDIDINLTFIHESENQLFQFSLLTDNPEGKRISFADLQISHEFLNEKFENSLNTNIVYTSLNIPIFIIKTDSNIWICPTFKFSLNDYKRVELNDNQFRESNEFLDFVLNGRGQNYLSKKGEEQLELFDQNKIPRGIFPRNSFYNTDHYQYVIWGLVFNREGKLLIHKRKENAKDNQNMWDKSVGGHIDFRNERSTNIAAVRELIEELYTEEKKEQTGHAFSMLSEDPSKVLFLGDWRKESYGSDYFNHINVLDKKKKKGEENWVYYKIPESITHNTPRQLPNNIGERWLRVITDVFIFITNSGIDDNYIQNNLKNSQYRLVEPNKLKSFIDNKIDDHRENFIITPDLKFIMTGKLRETISEVSNSIKYSTIRK